MDPGKFSKPFPGKLVRSVHNPRDWTFIPEQLPPRWEFPSHLWPLLADAREALGTLNGIGQVLPDPRLLLTPLQNREAIESSKIENTFVTPEELLLFELDPREPRTAGEKRADWHEVFNYNTALRHGWSELEKMPVCNRVIKEMHAILMRGVRGRDKSPGEFRKCGVQIGTNSRFVPPPASDVEGLMANLELFTNRATDRFDPLVKCYLVHYQFEAIHPFADGNGRVGRALLALMIYRSLGHSMPWLYLSAFFEKHRDEYIDRLFEVSTQGDWAGWIELCLRGTIVQAKDSVRRCHRFNEIRRSFLARMDDHSPRTCQIIESLFQAPMVTIPSVAKQFGVEYQTARSDIQRLVDANILQELSHERPRSFYAAEIMGVAYGDLESEVAANPDEALTIEGDPDGLRPPS